MTDEEEVLSKIESLANKDKSILSLVKTLRYFSVLITKLDTLRNYKITKRLIGGSMPAISREIKSDNLLSAGIRLIVIDHHRIKIEYTESVNSYIIKLTEDVLYVLVKQDIDLLEYYTSKGIIDETQTQCLKIIIKVIIDEPSLLLST